MKIVGDYAFWRNLIQEIVLSFREQFHWRPESDVHKYDLAPPGLRFFGDQDIKNYCEILATQYPLQPGFNRTFITIARSCVFTDLEIYKMKRKYGDTTIPSKVKFAIYEVCYLVLSSYFKRISL